MALTDKNILITPNIGSNSDPQIVFYAADGTTSAQQIAIKAYPQSNGTLSFEASNGQMFSITNTMTGVIHSVNDVSGIPSLEVYDTGEIRFAQYSGNVWIGGALYESRIAMPAANIDLSRGNYFTKTITGSTTFTVSGVPATGKACCFILDITNGGSQTVTYMSGTKWASGVAPSLTISGRDVLAFFTHDGGSTWNGFVLGKAMA